MKKPGVSVIVPTRGRAADLRRCLRGLCGQTVGKAAFDVLVSVDGPEDGEAKAVREVWGLIEVCLIDGERRGPAAARNRALAAASGELVLFLNDDVEPSTSLIERHIRAHEDRRAAGLGQAMVLGAAPWAVVDTPAEPDRLLDRMVRETSAVFFYDQMTRESAGPAAEDEAHDWGFRHAWTLNLSVHAELAREGFEERLPAPIFEDIEWAWRVGQRGASRGGVPVVYRPGAVVTHHHRYTAAGYLERERAIGRNTVALARVNAACARAIFRRDVGNQAELRERMEVVRRGAGEAAAWIADFARLAERPGADPSSASEAAARLYRESAKLRQWLRASGFVEAWEQARAAA